jgi:hypothetical protein
MGAKISLITQGVDGKSMDKQKEVCQAESEPRIEYRYILNAKNSR